MVPDALRHKYSLAQHLRPGLARHNTMHPDAILEVDEVLVGASREDMRVVSERGDRSGERRHGARNARHRSRWVVLCQEAEGLAAARGQRRSEGEKRLREIAEGI